MTAGYPVTPESIEIELNKAVVTQECDWKFIGRCFNLQEPAYQKHNTCNAVQS